MRDDSKKTFWIVATVITLIAVSAAVAYFVTKYVKSRKEEQFEDLYGCDCDFIDDCCDFDCDCGCDCDCETADEQ